MSKTITKRALLLMLSFAMVISMMPVLSASVYATDTSSWPTAVPSGCSHSSSNHFYSTGDTYDYNGTTCVEGRLFYAGGYADCDGSDSFNFSASNFKQGYSAGWYYFSDPFCLPCSDCNPKVASVTTSSGTTNYDTLQAALDAAEDGDTVQLLDNVEETVTVNKGSGVAFTLDLNGKNITSDNSTATLTNSGSGILTIKDSSAPTKPTKSGKIENTNKGADAHAVYASAGSIIIENGQYAAATDTVFADNGTISIKQGCFTTTPDISYIAGGSLEGTTNGITRVSPTTKAGELWAGLSDNGVTEYEVNSYILIADGTNKAFAIHSVGDTISKTAANHIFDGLANYNKTLNNGFSVAFVSGMGANTSVGGKYAANKYIAHDDSSEAFMKATAKGGQLRVYRTASGYDTDYIDLRLQYRFKVPSGLLDNSKNTKTGSENVSWSWKVYYVADNGTTMSMDIDGTNYIYDETTGEYISNAVVEAIPAKTLYSKDFSAELTLSYTDNGVTYTITQDSPLTRNVAALVASYNDDTTDLTQDQIAYVGAIANKWAEN